LKIVLVWTDPAGASLVNDLDLRVVDPSGFAVWGNDRLHPGQPDRVNNVEAVSIPQPLSGIYSLSVSANRIGTGPRQSYALVFTGDVVENVRGRSRASRH
jgi:uncharacterized protein YfaP (DUF2135 family)